jgi:hypothetical protein
MNGKEAVWVMRQVTVEIRNQDELTKMKEDVRSGVSVWVMRQLKVRMRDQDSLTERKGDEESEGSWDVTMRQRSRGVEIISGRLKSRKKKLRR